MGNWITESLVKIFLQRPHRVNVKIQIWVPRNFLFMISFYYCFSSITCDFLSVKLYYLQWRSQFLTLADVNFPLIAFMPFLFLPLYLEENLNVTSTKRKSICSVFSLYTYCLECRYNCLFSTRLYHYLLSFHLIITCTALNSSYLISFGR